MSTIDINDILAKSKYGVKYNDMPLGTDLLFFRFLCELLRGHLDTFSSNFTPPGYDNPEYKPTNRGLSVSIFGFSSLFVAVLVVIARLGTRSLRAAGGRIKTGKKDDFAWEGITDWEWWKPWKRYGLRFGRLGWDDWAIVVALALLAGYTTLNCLSVTHGGMGKHVYDVSLNSVRFLLKTTFVHSVLYLTLAFFIKLSILLFYLELFPQAFTNMRRTIYCLIVLLFVYTVVGTTITCLVCRPVKAFWTLELRASDNCPSQAEIQKRYISILAIHVVGDFIVLMLPMHLITTLHLPRRQKISLVFLFSAGGLACIASCVRLYYFPRINSDLDITWNVTNISLWGQVEASTAVICASVPSLKPLFSSLNTKVKHPPHPPRRLPTLEVHSSNGSFTTNGLLPSRGRTSDVTTADVSPNREKRASYSQTRTGSINSCAARHGVGDAYDRELAEIDNIDGGAHLGEAKNDAHPGTGITLTPPQLVVHKGGQAQGKMDNLNDQRSMRLITHSSNVSSLSLNTNSSQYLSVPQQDYLNPRQGHRQLLSPRTQFGESEATLTPTTPSSKKSNSCNGSCQSSPRKSSSISTSKALPALPAETYYTPGRTPHKEERISPPFPTTIPHVYPQHGGLDTTGIDCTYYAATAMGHRRSSGTHVEWGGWGGYYGGAEMV